MSTLTPALISPSISVSLHLHLKGQNFLQITQRHSARHICSYVHIRVICSPRSALTWEDWLQAAACSSREQGWRRALGGNNFTPDPPLPRPRPQHELCTGFRKRERHRVNQQRQRDEDRAEEDERRDERSRRKMRRGAGGVERLKSMLG